ncbi:MAG: HAMP domain-containing histidine kinase [Candidatus Moranbacteria bacterium]|nr:HAMP domain-containing histidine kinase [Candidatus Moranbacteria bacterium]
MKLIKRTYQASLLWLIPVLLIGSVFCFYMIKYIIYEETDEFLTYEMERLIEYHSRYNDLPEFHKVADILEGVRFDNPVFKDTLILEPRDNEMIPHRELYFSIKHEGKDFTIVLRHLLPGNDDIFEGTILMMGGLLLLISLALFLMVNNISGRIWKPFYKTLHLLTRYRINESVPSFSESRIDEFNLLNTTIEGFLKKIASDYQRNKDFNENASHELQTHLAVIRVNAERLLNTNPQENYQNEFVKPILNATIKLSQVQKSLLLLSRIGNLEFNNNTSINLRNVVMQSLELFQETIAIRAISVELYTEECVLLMDKGLAEVLVNNLIKNAVKHNIQNGFISIHLTPNFLLIENSGLPFQGSPETLFERFSIGTKGNLGLGLAIVKQICDVYKFEINYAIDENVHKIRIIFIRK